MRITVLIVASLALFVLAAKTHGRELRLEREAAGIRSVSFGGQNPPFVEKLWQAERVRSAVLMPLCWVALLAALWMMGMGAGRSLLGAAAFGPALAFLLLGVASFFRGGALVRGQVAGSFAWWSLLLLAGGLLGWIGWVRASLSAE